MPNTRSANAVRLEFAPGSLVHTNLSGAAFTGDWLWVAGDEACGLDRLRRLDPVGRGVLRFGEVRDFPLSNLLDLPGTAEEEADPEGLAVDGHRLLLGLRGPVLRGWSALLEIAVDALCDLPTTPLFAPRSPKSGQPGHEVRGTVALPKRRTRLMGCSSGRCRSTAGALACHTVRVFRTWAHGNSAFSNDSSSPHSALFKLL